MFWAAINNGKKTQFWWGNLVYAYTFKEIGIMRINGPTKTMICRHI